MITRRTVRAAAALLALTLASAIPSAGPARAGTGCHVVMLNGLYAYSANGHLIDAGGNALPKTALALMRFNGDGTVSVRGAAASINGAIDVMPAGGTGTYTIADLVPSDAGCGGSISFAPDGPTFLMYVQPDVAVLRLIQADANNVFQGTATLVAP